jgi:hypothetical protein
VRPLKELADWVGQLEERGLPMLRRMIGERIPAMLVEAADQLRRESARFYAVAMLLVMAALVVMWMR